MPTYTKPFLLSDQGSDRASAYVCSNKAVTLSGKTHVVWTDAVAITQARTLDHATDTWGPTITLGEGTDNHNSPSLTADETGRLQLAYGPHAAYQPYNDKFPAGLFKIVQGKEPGSFAGMDGKPGMVGYSATYASLLATGPGRAALVYRGGESPFGLIFQQRREQGGWTAARELMRQEIKPEYTHWGAIVSADRAGTLYVAGHFYALSRGHSLGVAVIKSSDGGATWTDLSGRPADVPIVYGERFAVPHSQAKFDPRCEGLELDGRGRPWVLTSNCNLGIRSMPLSVWESGRWRTVDLAAFIPADRSPVAGGLCVDARGRIHVACSTVLLDEAMRQKSGAAWWSHASLEVAHLMSDDDGETFSHHQVSETDDSAPNWLPTISRSSPCHPVEEPVILYTHGATGQHTNPGDPCRPTTRTRVLVVRVVG